MLSVHGISTLKAACLCSFQVLTFLFLTLGDVLACILSVYLSVNLSIKLVNKLVRFIVVSCLHIVHILCMSA